MNSLSSGPAECSFSPGLPESLLNICAHTSATYMRQQRKVSSAHLISTLDEEGAKMAAHKAGSACDQDTVVFHPWLGLDQGFLGRLLDTDPGNKGLLSCRT